MNTNVLEKLEELIDKPINPFSSHHANSAETIDKTFHCQKRLLLKKGRTFGLTVRRWYTIQEDRILMYKSRNSKKPKKTKSLLNTKVRTDNRFANKENRICINIVFADKKSIWITMETEPQKQQLLAYLSKYSLSTKGDQPHTKKVNTESQSQASMTINLESGLTKYLNNEITITQVQTKREDVDLPEKLSEDISFVSAMAKYSKNDIKAKGELEIQWIPTSDRKMISFHDFSKNIHHFTNELIAVNPEKIELTVTEGNRSSTIPVSEHKVSDLKTKTMTSLSVLRWETHFEHRGRFKKKSCDQASPKNRIDTSPEDLQYTILKTGDRLTSIPKLLFERKNIERLGTKERDSQDVKVVRSLSDSFEKVKTENGKLPWKAEKAAKSQNLSLDASLEIDSHYNDDLGSERSSQHSRANSYNCFSESKYIFEKTYTTKLSTSAFGPHISARMSPIENIKSSMREGTILTSKDLPIVLEENHDHLNVLLSTEPKQISGNIKANCIPHNAVFSSQKKLGLRRSMLLRLVSVVKARLDKPINSSILTAPPSPEAALNLVHEFRIKEAHDMYMALSQKDYKYRLSAIECDLLLLGLAGSRKETDSILQKVNEFGTWLQQQSTPLKKNINEFLSHEIIRAECNLMKSVMNAILGNKLQGLLCISESWSVFKKLDILLENKKLNETIEPQIRNRIIFGVGFFNLIFSLFPQSLLRVMRIIGFSPNRTTGIKKLQTCWRNKTVRSAHAALLLCVYHLEFGSEILHACKVVELALKDYPCIPYFLWLGAVVSWKFCQPEDVKVTLKLAISMSKPYTPHPFYLDYEIGWYYFLCKDWSNAKKIMEKIAMYSISKELLSIFEQEFTKTVTGMKSKLPSPAIEFHPLPIELQDDYIVFPHSVHNILKIAACCLELKNEAECRYWLVTALVVHRRFSNVKTKNEEEFSRLTEKFLRRKSLTLFTFELWYFLKYIPKLPDQSLLEIIDFVNVHLEKIKSQGVLTKGELLVEFVGGMLLTVCSYCLIGSSALAVEKLNTILSVIDELDEEYHYLGHHLLYWLGRGLAMERRMSEAMTCFKKALRWKKCIFTISEKIKKSIQSNNTEKLQI